MAGVHKSGDSSPNNNLSKRSVDADILKEKLTTVSADMGDAHLVNGLAELLQPSTSCARPASTADAPNFNQIIFNTRIAAKEEYEVADDGPLASDEEIQLLPSVEVVAPQRTEFNCSGHDWGISWPVLLAVILVVAFVGPLIILYLAEQKKKSHHS